MEKYFTRLLVVLSLAFISNTRAKTFQEADCIYRWYSSTERLPRQGIKVIFSDVHGYPRFSGGSVRRYIRHRQTQVHYHFHDRDPDFDSGYPLRLFTFRIPFLFHQTLWFKSGTILCSLLLVLLGVKLRMQYIKNKNVLLADKIDEHTRQLNDTITALRKTRDDLYLQNESQRKLIATLTHDIKNPLGYMAYVSRQAYQQFDGKDHIMKAHLKSIYTSSSQLSELVTNLLDYTTIYDRTADSTPEVFNLFHLAEQKIALFKNLAETQRTKIINAVPAPLNIVVNRAFLSIIIHNLMDNAVKNTFNGIITIGCKTRDGQISVFLQDTGTGMPPEVLGYYRSYPSNIDNETYKRKYKGMGVKIISELLIIMQGKLEIDSKPGKGTLVKVTFEEPAYNDFS